jgi:hypothetical protein
MYQSKEKYPISRSASTRSVEKKRSMIRIPSTSKIPKDFFRKPVSIVNSSTST